MWLANLTPDWNWANLPAKIWWGPVPTSPFVPVTLLELSKLQMTFHVEPNYSKKIVPFHAAFLKYTLARVRSVFDF